MCKSYSYFFKERNGLILAVRNIELLYQRKEWTNVGCARARATLPKKGMDKSWKCKSKSYMIIKKHTGQKGKQVEVQKLKLRFKERNGQMLDVQEQELLLQQKKQ